VFLSGEGVGAKTQFETGKTEMEDDFFRKDIRVELPREVGRLRDTGKFRLNYCSVTTVPEKLWDYANDHTGGGEWWKIEAIVAADLGYNELTRLEHQWSIFGSSLQTLKLHYNSIEEIDPETFKNLIELQHLDLSHNQLRFVPDDISSLAGSLSHLNLSCNKLTVLPDSITELVNLTHLELEECQLTQLPERIGNLKSLTVLNCGENHLKQLPDSVAELETLRELNLSKNFIEQVPESIETLQELQVLNLAYNQLTSLPRLPANLVSLTVSFNKVSSLEGAVEKLHNLESLDVRNNKIEDITPATNCLKLKSIDASSNPLVELPYELHRLENLFKLILENVDLTSVSRTLINRGAESVKTFLKARGPRKIKVSSQAVSSAAPKVVPATVSSPKKSEESKEIIFLVKDPSTPEVSQNHERKETQVSQNNLTNNSTETVKTQNQVAEEKIELVPAATNAIQPEAPRELSELELLTKKIKEMEAELKNLGITRTRTLELKRELNMTRSKKIHLEKALQA
jgi:Leucine-rich repeat (LRR) protein